MKLSVSKRNQSIQKIDLGKDVLAFDRSETVFLVGRSKECHVVIDDKQISREHLKIIHQNGKWTVEKNSDENAALFNGEDFTKEQLEVGSTISVGAYTITIDSIDVQDGIISSQEVTGLTGNGLERTKKVQIPQEIAHPVKDETIESDKNEDETKEIDVNDLTREIEVDVSDPINSDLINDAEEKISDEVTDESEFSAGDKDEEVSIALSVHDLDSISTQPAGEENTSYSLENIDSGTGSFDEGTKVVNTFAKIQLELFGDTAPYDKFNVEKNETFIGRDPNKCQIVLDDNEVSSVHAVIRKNNIIITLEDLNSSNGTILNGDRINKAVLSHNDEFVIGGVTFTLKIRSDFLKEENQTLMPVEEDQVVEVEEVEEVEVDEDELLNELNQDSEASKEKSILKRIWKDETQRKKLIYGAVVLVGLWVFLDDGEQAPVVQAPKKTNESKKTSDSTKKELEPFKIGEKKKNLTEEEKRALSARYEIAKNHFYNGRYREALEEFEKVVAIDKDFMQVQTLISKTKESIVKIEEQEKKRQAEILAAEKKSKIRNLLEKAREYTRDHRVELANETFNEITKIDPENYEVNKLKAELDDWEKSIKRKAEEEERKKKEREDRIDKLKPGKSLYIQREWFKAITKLEDFLKIKNMDEDLTKEATDMLKTCKDEISSAVSPLQGKAKSLLEGQDLKGAYEVYQQILRIEPSNVEALNQSADIKEQLTTKARKIYREAIISESLSLFQDAKEKFQEVQQVSPVDSEYYKKASDKLKDYLE